MSVCTSEAEGTDGSAALFSRRFPAPGLGVYIKRGALGGDGRVLFRAMKRGRDHLILKRQQDLDDSGDTRSRRRMTDVGLDRSDGAIPFPAGVTAKGAR